MFVNNTHKIKSVVVDVEYNQLQADHFKIQHEVKDWAHSFLKKIEDFFDGIGMERESFYADRILLDVNVDENDWQKTAEAKLLSQLKEQFPVKTIESKLEEDVEANNDTNFSNNFQQAFVYYLKHGHLPWNFYNVKFHDWKRSVVTSITNEKNEKQRLQKKVIEVLASSNEARTRLAGILPFEKILFLLTDDIVEREDARKVYTSMDQADRGLFSIFLQEIFLFKNDGSSSFDSFQTATEMSVRMKDVIAATQLKSSVFKKFQSRLRKFASQGQSEFPFKDETIFFDATQPASATTVLRSIKIEESAAVHRSILKEGIFIENAGLILVASFLPMLFKNLRLLKNNTLTSPPKTVLVLNFLVTGQWQCGDYALTLPKILCGLNAETFVDVQRFRISTRIKKECEALLLSVIGHWSVLKNTSPAGLRNSFLQRNGKLSFENDKWLLQVERNSYDMLLDQLPWSYTIIKLPWMKNIMTTEW
ncbi:MAG: hypothetical protein BGN92_08475 [Sphingobacteriales bacterium 41-5]|nr:MAG: hypothetical protein ABS67_03235 [Niabella sp. SCN 42-15]OJU22577.1 MAG: hypothetical protein BGN92_08475 [Sphingobacteriales bacterium 41-5]